MAVNLSYNRVLKTSPYIFKHGKHPRHSIDIKFGRKEICKPIQELHKIRDNNFEKYSTQSISKGKISCKNEYDLNDNVLVYIGYKGISLSLSGKKDLLLQKKL